MLAPLLLPAQPQEEVKVDVRFEPRTLTEGRTGQLIVSISQQQAATGMRRSSGRAQFSLPSVAGLNLRSTGVQNQQSIRSGLGSGVQISSTEIHTFAVQATGPGFFTLPGFEVQVGSRVYRTEPVSLEVIPEANAPDRNLVFMELVMPQEQVYVGELVKATVQIWVSEEIPAFQPLRINKIGTAFSEVSSSQQFIRSRAERNGMTYNLVSMPLTLMPIKGGEQTIQYESLLTIAASQSNNPRDLLFGLGITGVFNQGNSERRVQTPLRTINVKPLPLDGRPASFTGAIGSFGLRVQPMAAEVKLGEPVSLVLEVIGHGNFERIQPPALDLGKDWRALSPQSRYQGADALNYSGRKQFTYSLIPLSMEVAALPPIEFSYFNATDQQYQTLKSGPLPITILPNPDAEDLDAIFAEAAPLVREGPPPRLPYLTRMGTPTALPKPIATIPAFQITNIAAALLLLIGSGAWIAYQKRSRDERRRFMMMNRAAAHNHATSAAELIKRRQFERFMIELGAQLRAALSAGLYQQTSAWTADEIRARLKDAIEQEDRLALETCSYFDSMQEILYNYDQRRLDIDCAEWTHRTDRLCTQWFERSEGKMQ